MTKPGKLLADLAQCLMAPLRLDAAQTVGPPHGAAAINIPQISLPFLVVKVLPQGIPQGTLQIPVPGGGLGIHLDIPLMAAAVGTIGGDAGKLFIVRWINKLHIGFISYGCPVIPGGYTQDTVSSIITGSGGKIYGQRVNFSPGAKKNLAIIPANYAISSCKKSGNLL
jgi:hypothetical protein